MFLPLIPLAQVRRGPLDLLGQVPGWVLFALVVLALLIFGLRDLVRLSWARISAISSVSFQESIRRRVLWITPLAILGAIVVSQVQNPIDPQDAIRQTTKICLFATGLVVTLASIILACTNLPKEIENRVIYTIVTKPTTRLEIVLGKVWGFAKVSAAILLIMGLFTYGYLHVRAWRLSSVVESTLAGLPKDAVNRPSLEYYQTKGLLNAKAMSQPASLQVLADPPDEGQPRWMAGGQGQQFGMIFGLTPDDYGVVAEAVRTGGRASLMVDMPVRVREPTASEMEVIRTTNIPMREQSDPAATTAPAAPPAAAGPGIGPTPEPEGEPAPEKPGLPQAVLNISMRDADDVVIVDRGKLNGGEQIVLPPLPPGERQPLEVAIEPGAMDKLFEAGQFAVVVEGISPAVRYEVGDMPIKLQVFDAEGSPGVVFNPMPRSNRPMVTAAVGRYGQQIVGGEEGKGGVAAFRFERVRLPDGAGTGAGGGGDALTFEIRAGIERGGEATGETAETLPEVQLRVRDPESGNVSEPFTFHPETNRTSYVEVPRAAFPPGGGSFDVLVRVLTPDQWLGMQTRSLSLATATRPFSLNLFKSLLILWLMSVLVIAIAVFSSTFVSWPIAVVLTLVLLLGRWGVQQISDASGGGGLALGSTITTQTENPTQARVVRESVDALGRLLELLATFLPDVSQFQATADIERGISVPADRLTGAGWVLLGYGIPIVILAYLILKRKEVAP